MGDRLGIHGAVDTFLLTLVFGFLFLELMKGRKEGREGVSGELVPISPDRWLAVVGSEQDVVSVFDCPGV